MSEMSPGMRQPLGAYLVMVAFVLTWPLHIGAATFLLAEKVGEYFEPHKDHILFWFATLPLAGLLTVLLIVGVFMHRRVAFYGSAFAFWGGLRTLSRFAIHDAYDGLFEFGIALLLLLSALYLIWRARQLRTFSHEKRIV